LTEGRGENENGDMVRKIRGEIKIIGRTIRSEQKINEKKVRLNTYSEWRLLESDKMFWVNVEWRQSKRKEDERRERALREERRDARLRLA
jgi:hypothetical protein